MKKILSIIMALGLVLSMGLAAMPVAAQTCGAAAVTLTDDCAEATMVTYTIVFSITSTMLEGVDWFDIEFPAGTGFAATFGAVDGDVTIQEAALPPMNVDALDITLDGTTVSAMMPGTIFASTGNPKQVTIVVTKVTNPGDFEEDYELTVEATQGCCGVIGCWEGDYDILRPVSTYKFVLDFDTTYTGIAEDFIPPFQACGGQPLDVPGESTDPDFSGVSMTQFDVILKTDDEGCAGYGNVTVMFELVSAPTPTAVASLELFDGAVWHGWALEEGDDGEWGTPGFVLPAVYDVSTPAKVHFDTLGDYVFEFYLWDVDEEEMIGEPYVAPAKVYQWKTAYEIVLFPKWNLISLPIVPFVTDLDAALESFASPELVLGIYQYDTLAGEYDAYPGFGLDEMVDGKGYWMKMAYGGTNPPAGTIASPAPVLATWWVWGTDRPGDPPTPVSYDAFEGWNQIGFTSTTSAADTAYLSNWLSYWAIYGYGNIYGWTANTQTYAVQTPGAATLNPGMGYWVNFHYDGEIYF